jgi:protein SCO1
VIARVLSVAALIAALLAWPAASRAAGDLAQLAWQQRPGGQLPLDAVLRDETGQTMRLGALIGGGPAILALGYFHCPNLCGVLRADLTDALAGSGLHAPGDYALIVLSIDPDETAADARDAHRQDAARMPVPAEAAAWHYLTGSADALHPVEQAVGFRARFDPALRQFLHPAGLVFLTAQGGISSYLLGVGYRPGDLRAAVTRAGEGGVAKTALPVLLLCFHYDPTTGRYTLAVTRLVQLAAGLTVLTLGGTIALALRRERRR